LRPITSSLVLLERFSIECRKTKTKLITYQLVVKPKPKPKQVSNYFRHSSEYRSIIESILNAGSGFLGGERNRHPRLEMQRLVRTPLETDEI